MTAQEYFAALAETQRFTLDELQLLKQLPFALAQKVCGPVVELTTQIPVLVPPSTIRFNPPIADSIRLRSPDGAVWVLTITNEGRARTTKEA